MKMKQFKTQRVTGIVEDTIDVPVIDEFGGDAQQQVDVRVEWSYATKSMHSGAYMSSELQYITYARNNGLWAVILDLNFRKQLAMATNSPLRRAEELAKASMRERNLREGRILQPTVIPDFLDRARSI